MELSMEQYRKRVWPDNDLMHTTNYPITDDNTLCVNQSNNYNSDTNGSSSPTQISSSSPPIKRIANERERTRTASVNDAFLMLRSLIPTEPMNRKLSKIETLRLASSYISHLHAVLVTNSRPADQPCLLHHQQQQQHTVRTNPKHQNKLPNRPVCTFCVTEMKQHQRAIADSNNMDNNNNNNNGNSRQIMTANN